MFAPVLVSKSGDHDEESRKMKRTTSSYGSSAGCGGCAGNGSCAGSLSRHHSYCRGRGYAACREHCSSSRRGRRRGSSARGRNGTARNRDTSNSCRNLILGGIQNKEILCEDTTHWIVLCITSVACSGVISEAARCEGSSVQGYRGVPANRGDLFC
jgi:hypothetical protein